MGRQSPWDRTWMRAFIVGLLALLAMPIGVSAQEATPAGEPVAGLDLPELEIVVTATGYDGIPARLAAGRYLITLTAAEDASDFGLGGVGFVQPDGMSGADFLTTMDLALKERLTPDEEAAIDAAAFTAHYAGGANALLGQTVRLVIDLRPGEWVAWGEDPFTPWEPVIFEVTGEMPASLPEPTADVTLSLGEYVIAVSEERLASGPQVMRIDNIGAQAHFIEAGTVSVPITDVDVDAALGLIELGTPTEREFDFEQHFTDAFRTGIQSPGTTTWLATDIAPGTHLLACFFPDSSDFLPHAMHGMYAIVEVE